MNTLNDSDCRVIELRQYTLHPGRRDELVTLFEREFVATQAAAGLNVLATFLDADRPDRFVWFRGFADMARRATGLAAFYGGPAWLAHRDAANATMLDSDDVLLLKPLTAWPRAGTAGVWHAAVCLLADPPDDELRAALRAAGGCWLETEPAENDFPRLPVRSGEWAVVGLGASPPLLPGALQRRLRGTPQVLRLYPTPRSRLA